MTEKQEKIINSALRLFAEKGYDATSTSKVAREAEVSEGLIFRHFESKEGLLNAIMDMGAEMASKLYDQILKIENPRYALKSILRLPFTITGEQYHFWKLLYALKWQADIYDDSLSAPVKNSLIRIFTKLEYDDPYAEAEVVLMFIDGAATSVLLRRPENQEAVLQALLHKYGV